MAEIATDTIDQDLDDKMSEEDSKMSSSLPAQPAIITFKSISAASSVEPLTSPPAQTFACSSNAFTSAEYDQIEQVLDKVFSKCFSRNNDVSVIV